MVTDPRDAEIARLRAEVDRLTRESARRLAKCEVLAGRLEDATAQLNRAIAGEVPPAVAMLRGAGGER